MDYYDKIEENSYDEYPMDYYDEIDEHFESKPHENCYDKRNKKSPDYYDKKSKKPSTKISCESKIPFPPIEVCKCNIRYANLLYDSYASSGGSELQAITQYIYHHETIFNKEVSDTLLNIAIVEMRHLDALASLIVKLGGRPAFFNSNRDWFSTGQLAYGENVYKLECPPCKEDYLCVKLTADLAGEKAAIRGYKDLICEISDPKVNAVIEKIISDEQVHARILESFINKYCCGSKG
ncbi:bacterioferritin [Clostridium acetobutylicum]|nr:bacterioferritin [Clostridium acetobutylicum]